MFYKNMSLLIVFIILGLFAVSCGLPGFSGSATPTPAKTSITVYTSGGEAYARDIANTFNEEHPEIEVIIKDIFAGEIVDRLFLERNDPQADVVWIVPASYLLQAGAKGLLQSYAPTGLNRVDLRMRDFNDPPVFVGTDVFMTAFCVNTSKLAELGIPKPTSWTDLKNPLLKDQIVMPDPSLSSTGYMALAAFMQPSLFGSEQAGWAYMDALNENVAWYTKGGFTPCDLAAEGKVAVGISYGAGAVDQKANGIEAIFPAEGSGWEIEASALVRKSEIKPEALTFLDWAISDSAMRLYARGTPVTSVEIEDIPLPDGYIAEPHKQLIPLSFLWTTANRTRIVDLWIEQYGQKSEGRGAAIPEAFE
jgi:iron(III) transport system substrate-binding protein